MIQQFSDSKDSIVVLFKGGRLPTWELLPADRRRDYEQQHVDLMLAVAEQYGMVHFEGFKLLDPQGDWRRFWTIEFPTLEGAEAWIDAEMAPPYGLYGYYEYYLSRRWAQEYFSAWVTNPRPAWERPAGVDPHVIPPLAADPSSVVAIVLSRYRAGTESLSGAELGDDEHVALMRSIAEKHGLMRLEGFKLIAPQAGWHRAWLFEFPDHAGVDALIQGELAPPHGNYTSKVFYRAQRWAPEYCALWVPPHPRP